MTGRQLNPLPSQGARGGGGGKMGVHVPKALRLEHRDRGL